MKKAYLVSGLLMISQTGFALPRFVPERCAQDNLSQWTEGQSVQGTARGRNEWFKTCNPTGYDVAYPDGNEFEPNSTRRAYLTFGIITGRAANNDTIFDFGPWRAPTTPAPSPASPHCQMPAGYRLVGYCTSGCVTPDQKIATPGGSETILALEQTDAEEVSVPVRSFDDGLKLETLGIQSFIKDMVDAKQDIVVVTMKSGATLKLSKNHPMLTSEFKMKNAEDLKIGDQLVDASGQAVAVSAVQTVEYFGKVYNLTVDTTELEKSTYIVQGFISGDKKFQDLSVSEMNRRYLRNLAAQVN